MEGQRTRFCDAAAACITRQGLASTSLTDICREAGLSMGALYKHFSNREDLFAALVEQRASQRNALLRGDSWIELRHGIIRYLAERAQPLLHELNALCDWNERLNEIRARLGAVVLKQLSDQLRDYSAGGEISPPFGFDETAAFIALVFDGSIMRIRQNGDMLVSPEMLGQYLDFIVGLDCIPPASQ